MSGGPRWLPQRYFLTAWHKSGLRLPSWRPKFDRLSEEGMGATLYKRLLSSMITGLIFRRVAAYDIPSSQPRAENRVTKLHESEASDGN